MIEINLIFHFKFILIMLKTIHTFRLKQELSFSCLNDNSAKYELE